MFENDLIELINKYWDCSDPELVANSLIELFDTNEDLIRSIVVEDRIFNRYEYVFSWLDLAAEIIDESFLLEMDLDFEESLEEALEENNEDECKNLLLSQNWYLDAENGVAFGFDEDIKI